MRSNHGFPFGLFTFACSGRYVRLAGFAIALLTQLTAFADTVELVDGLRIEVAHIKFDEAQLTLDDGRVIPRSDIKRILFDRGSAAGAADSGVGKSDVAELLRTAAIEEKKYPDVGAIMLVDDGEMVLREDGTYFERSYAAFKILKEDWKSIAEIGQSFEEGRDRVTLVRARTIAPDGTVDKFDPADLQESKPSEGMDSFSEYKELSGHLDGVDVGSIVEIIWDRDTYNPYDKGLFHENWSFRSTEPVVWSRFTVHVPSGQKLYFQTRNMPETAATPQITESETQTTYRWEMSDLPPVIPEPDMPPLFDVVPALRVGIQKDWNYLFDFLGAFQKEHIQVTPAIESRVREIAKDAETPEEKLAALYRWLQREIRYVSIKGSLGSGWSGHPADATLANGYGDCIDKAILFTTMLKVVGIKSYPVLLSTNNQATDDRTLPTLNANHAINKIYLGDRAFYLDTTAETFRYPYFRPDDHGVSTIDVLEREIGFIGVPPPDDNAIDLAMDLHVDGDGNVDGDVTLHMTGAIEARLRSGLEQINKVMLKMVAQQVINSISPGAELKNIDISDEADLTTPLVVTLQVRLPEYPSFAGDLMILPLPLSERIHQYAEASLEERKFDIDYGSSSKLSQQVQLHLPEGYVAKGLPDPLNLTSPYVDYHASFSSDGTTIVFEESLEMPKRIVPQKDYLEHRKNLEKISHFARHPVFLKKPSKGQT